MTFRDLPVTFPCLSLPDPHNFVISALPICLPSPDLDFRGKETVAMGWGMYENWALKKENDRDKSSTILKYVRLKVSNRKFKNKNFFGTEVNKTRLEPSKMAILEQCNTENHKALKNSTHINVKKTLKDTLGAVQN